MNRTLTLRSVRILTDVSGPARLISIVCVPICSPLRTIANLIVSADTCVAVPSKATPITPAKSFMRSPLGAVVRVRATVYPRSPQPQLPLSKKIGAFLGRFRENFSPCIDIQVEISQQIVTLGRAPDVAGVTRRERNSGRGTFPAVCPCLSRASGALQRRHHIEDVAGTGHPARSRACTPTSPAMTRTLYLETIDFETGICSNMRRSRRVCCRTATQKTNSTNRRCVVLGLNHCSG